MNFEATAEPIISPNTEWNCIICKRLLCLRILYFHPKTTVWAEQLFAKATHCLESGQGSGHPALWAPVNTSERGSEGANWARGSLQDWCTLPATCRGPRERAPHPGMAAVLWSLAAAAPLQEGYILSCFLYYGGQL